MNQNKMEITQKTAQQIKMYRLRRGLSQEALARSAGLNPAFLGHIERCLKCPSVDTLNKIASALGLSISELLDFDEGEEQEEETDRKERVVQKIISILRGLSPEEAEEIYEIIFEIIRFKNR